MKMAMYYKGICISLITIIYVFICTSCSQTPSESHILSSTSAIDTFNEVSSQVRDENMVSSSSSNDETYNKFDEINGLVEHYMSAYIANNTDDNSILYQDYVVNGFSEEGGCLQYFQ